jgi:hypothetical protein
MGDLSDKELDVLWTYVAHHLGVTGRVTARQVREILGHTISAGELAITVTDSLIQVSAPRFAIELIR